MNLSEKAFGHRWWWHAVGAANDMIPGLQRIVMVTFAGSRCGVIEHID